MCGVMDVSICCNMCGSIAHVPYLYLHVQKRYGAFGASMDEYRMELCPLQYATQWQHFSDSKERKGAEPLQSWHLGVWDGQIVANHNTTKTTNKNTSKPQSPKTNQRHETMPKGTNSCTVLCDDAYVCLSVHPMVLDLVMSYDM